MLIIYKELTLSKFVLLSMLSIILLGTGNVAHHLFYALINNDDIHIKQVYGKNSQTLSNFSSKCETTSDPKEIEDADLFIIAVNDDAISEVATSLSTKSGIVVHTSGSVPMNVITQMRKGVFYPLQTFSKDKKIDFSSIPICIEANDKEDLKIVEEFARKITDKVYEVSSEQRQKLHLAAVFVNNFTNHMYAIGNDICEKEGLSFDLLIPLIKETADKLRFLSPKNAQTGPAKRNDVLTMQKHLDSIESPIHKKLYQLISESIKEQNEEKL